MPNETLLIVEDAPDIQTLLKIYFSSHGYEVHTAGRGSEALELLRRLTPHLALLDVNLPDMLGYDIGRAIRANPRTRNLPIIFLTARTEKRDIMVGLGEVEADAYVAKPFDIELLHLEVRNALKRSRQRAQMHPVTNLPTAEAITEQLRALLNRQDWALASMRIEHFDEFTQGYGSLSGEDVLKFTAMLLNDALAELGQTDDFVGHLSTGPEFVLITTPERGRAMIERVVARFDDEIGLHYSYHDRKNGAMKLVDADGSERSVPFMSLAIGLLDARHGPFYDIRELTEAVENARQSARQQSSATGKSALIIA
ncbi:response regulator [Kallotenue papyrolyticum]|uniref:response regulator n=1 Tax=Kallotenue papyrolyticum TaxID=1325125 RepID=UPI000492621A|nr:response regulator [Kallotenue papyrolyticum]